jgi:hypothetical protein
MATLNANTIYLTIAGTNYSAYWVSFKLNGKNNVKETTAGSGTTHVERAAGLNDYSADVTVVYDSAIGAQQLGHYSPGDIVAVEWGPESNVSGKPRHVQNFIVEEAPFEVVVEKEKVAFELKLSGSEAPSVDIYSGAVY